MECPAPGPRAGPDPATPGAVPKASTPGTVWAHRLSAVLADFNTGINGSTLGEALGFSLLCRLKDSREQGRGAGEGEPELTLPFGRRLGGVF